MGVLDIESFAGVRYDIMDIPTIEKNCLLITKCEYFKNKPGTEGASFWDSINSGSLKALTLNALTQTSSRSEDSGPMSTDRKNRLEEKKAEKAAELAAEPAPAAAAPALREERLARLARQKAAERLAAPESLTVAAAAAPAPAEASLTVAPAPAAVVAAPVKPIDISTLGMGLIINL